MREIRQSGSEGGAGFIPRPCPYQRRGSEVDTFDAAAFPEEFEHVAFVGLIP